MLHGDTWKYLVKVTNLQTKNNNCWAIYNKNKLTSKGRQNWNENNARDMRLLAGISYIKDMVVWSNRRSMLDNETQN